MANEAAITIVGRMRDEITPQMKSLSRATNEAAISTGALGEESYMTSDRLQELTVKSLEATVQTFQLNLALTAMGSALTAVGSLISKIDNPTAKMASNFLLIGGAILTTTSSIIQMIPYIRQMITWLRSLAIVQTVVKALSGPIGWAQVGIGLGIAAAGTAAIYGMTGGFGGGGRGGQTVVNINAQAFAGNTAEARKFASKVQRYSREETSMGR
jgi:hypothetical protein